MNTKIIIYQMLSIITIFTAGYLTNLSGWKSFIISILLLIMGSVLITFILPNLWQDQLFNFLIERIRFNVDFKESNYINI